MSKRHCTCPRRPNCPISLPLCRSCFAALPSELRQEWTELWDAWAKLDALRRLRRTIRSYNAARLQNQLPS